MLIQAMLHLLQLFLIQREKKNNCWWWCRAFHPS
jgi:hypothetical protein